MSAAPAPVLSVRDLHVSYRTPDGPVPAVRGISFDVAPGETVALIGGSGSGKSTTAHAVVRLLDDSAVVTGGSVVVDGIDVLALPERRLRTVRGARVGLVPQDPGLSLNPVERIGDQLVEALRLHGLARGRAARARAVDLLRDAGLDDAERVARQRPHELSGGMRQRVLIAIALAADPVLLLADEPTSALDVTVQRRVLDHLADRARRSGAAVLLVTHDLGVAADRADRLLVVHDGRVVEQGRTAEVLADPRSAYTRELLAAAPGLRSATSAVPRRAAAPVDARPPVLAARGLTKDFALPRTAGGRGPRTLRAVDAVDLQLTAGRTLGLVGESGSGKTTLTRLLLHLERPTAGRIEVDGQDVTGLRGEALRLLRRRVQVVHQNPYAALDPRHDVERIVTEPLRHFGVGDPASRRATAAALLEQVALPSAYLRRRPAQLSGGQRQRVAIARALAVQPEVVVCDEAVSALDVTVQAQILALLVDLQERTGVALLFVSHDLGVVQDVSHEVAVMQRGAVVEAGASEAVLRHPSHPCTRALLDAVPGRRTTGHAPDPTTSDAATPTGTPTTQGAR